MAGRAPSTGYKSHGQKVPTRPGEDSKRICPLHLSANHQRKQQVRYGMEQHFTHTEKKQSRINNHSGYWFPMTNGSFPVANTGQFACVYLSHTTLEGPCPFTEEDQFNRRVGWVLYDAHALSTHKGAFIKFEIGQDIPTQVDKPRGHEDSCYVLERKCFSPKTPFLCGSVGVGRLPFPALQGCSDWRLFAQGSCSQANEELACLHLAFSGWS